MKKSLFLAMLLVSLILPWACSDNNNNPTKPPAAAVGSGGSGGGSGAPTATIPPVNTPFGSGTLTPTPTFVNNYGTSSSPNGMYYDGNGNLLVMEGVPGITNWTGYAVNPVSGVLVGGGVGNGIAVGVPTPGVVPPWVAPVTNILQLPQGIAFNTNGTGDFCPGAPLHWWAILDSSPSGSATLYEGGNYPNAGFVCPSLTAGYAGVTYSSPRAIVSDTTQPYFYVADTGNGYVDVMGLGDWSNGGHVDIGWPHRWNGSASNYTFKKPVALAIDAYDNLFVGDAGYTPSVVEEYSQEGTYLGGQWTLTPGCVINGLAVDSLANTTGEDLYVSDTANGGQVEEYQITGPRTLVLVRTWGVTPGTPLGNLYHEYLPFVPSCIALIQAFTNTAIVGPFPPPTQIIVGDANNNLLLEFGP